MRALDQIFTARPFYGSRRLRADLREDYGLALGRDHVRRLMRVMGLQTIYPKPGLNTSLPCPEHWVYPYLLGGIAASFSNHIWGSDITYIRLSHGFCYLYAIIDWWSRLVVGWALSSTLESDFCLAAMTKAISVYGAPEISNTDQGSQFTGKKFIAILEQSGIKVSMDGRGRCLDNVFTERLWRSLKYEEVYLKSYQTIEEAREGIAAYFDFYNEARRHQSLGERTPRAVFESKKPAHAGSETTPQIINLNQPLLSPTAV